jgi:RluA family pseudouridine synthase
MIPVIFEDNDIVAIDKPENLASIPTRVAGEETVLSLLTPRFPGKLFVVHRLDKEVSGVMLFAKNAEAHKRLNAQFFNRSVKKTYLLIAHGVIAEDSGVIDKPVRQFGSGRMGVDEVKGKQSATRFSIIQRTDKFSLVRAMPLSGRRHQIRVHFYSIGHSIVGDVRYGSKAAQQPFPRLMLHAASIAFALPSGEIKTVEAPLPQLIGNFLATLGMSAPF